MRLLKRPGFSLIEVLIAISVLSVGMLGLMSAMMFGLKGADHAQRITEANNYARALIEYIRIGNRTSLTTATDATPVSLTAAPYSSEEVLIEADAGTSGPGWGYFPRAAGQRYKRQVTCTRILPVGGLAPFGKPNLYEIRVKIFWTNSGSEFASQHEKMIELVGYHKS